MWSTMFRTRSFCGAMTRRSGNVNPSRLLCPDPIVSERFAPETTVAASGCRFSCVYLLLISSLLFLVISSRRFSRPSLGVPGVLLLAAGLRPASFSSSPFSSPSGSDGAVVAAVVALAGTVSPPSGVGKERSSSGTRLIARSMPTRRFCSRAGRSSVSISTARGVTGSRIGSNRRYTIDGCGWVVALLHATVDEAEAAPAAAAEELGFARVRLGSNAKVRILRPDQRFIKSPQMEHQGSRDGQWPTVTPA
uniref:Uncharacterized protein n=1 Tax=Anopheles merus TaxID=30066 RepID=A0A182UN49_ANOME